MSSDSYCYHYGSSPTSSSPDSSSSSGTSSKSCTTSEQQNVTNPHFHDGRNHRNGQNDRKFGFNLLILNLSLIYPSVVLFLFVISIASIQAKYRYTDDRVAMDRGHASNIVLVIIGGIFGVLAIALSGNRTYREYNKMKEGLISLAKSNAYGLHLISTVTLFIPFCVNLWYLFVWQEDVGYKADVFFTATRFLVTIMPLISECEAVAGHFSTIVKDVRNFTMPLSPFAAPFVLLITLQSLNLYITESELIENYDSLYWISMICWCSIGLMILFASWIRLGMHMQVAFALFDTFATALYVFGIIAFASITAVDYILNDRTHYVVTWLFVGIGSLPLHCCIHILFGKTNLTKHSTVPNANVPEPLTRSNVMTRITMIGGMFGLWIFGLTIIIAALAKNYEYYMVYGLSAVTGFFYIAQYTKIGVDLVKTDHLKTYQEKSVKSNITFVFGIPLMAFVYYELMVGYSDFERKFTVGIFLIHLAILGTLMYFVIPRVKSLYELIDGSAQDCNNHGDNIIRFAVVIIGILTINTILMIGETYGIERGYLTDTQDQSAIDRGIAFLNSMIGIKVTLICMAYVLMSQRTATGHVYWLTRKSYTKSVSMVGTYYATFFVVMPIVFGIMLDVAFNSASCDGSSFTFECNDRTAYSYYTSTFFLYLISFNPTPFFM